MVTHANNTTISALVASAALLCQAPLWAADAAEPQPPAAAGEAAMTPPIETGSTVQLHYKLTVDGEVVDSSQDAQPLSYVHGQGQLIPGLEKHLAGMKAGQAGDFTVSAEEGYGTVDPQAFIEVPRTQLPQDVTPEIGMMLRGTAQDGRPFRARVHQISPESVILDLNHPLAGKILNFHISVVSVAPKA
jgi:FKBP-type peptidyl-prolyl cis-trans isomerase 2